MCLLDVDVVGGGGSVVKWRYSEMRHTQVQNTDSDEYTIQGGPAATGSIAGGTH